MFKEVYGERVCRSVKFMKMNIFQMIYDLRNIKVYNLNLTCLSNEKNDFWEKKLDFLC